MPRDQLQKNEPHRKTRSDIASIEQIETNSLCHMLMRLLIVTRAEAKHTRNDNTMKQFSTLHVSNSTLESNLEKPSKWRQLRIFA